MLVSRLNGWKYDTESHEFSGHGHVGVLPEVSRHAIAHFGLGYLDSQAATRTVQDNFKKRWVAANPGLKAKDAPKDVVPPTDSEAYKAELAAVHANLAEKLLSGYEVGARGEGDPVAVETDNLVRPWFQRIALAKGWYVNPSRSTTRIAKDDDEYANTKHGATFGEAMQTFRYSSAPVATFLGKNPDGTPYPAKAHKGETVADFITREVARRVADNAPKPAIAFGEEVSDEL